MNEPLTISVSIGYGPEFAWELKIVGGSGVAVDEMDATRQALQAVAKLKLACGLTIEQIGSVMPRYEHG